MVAAMPRRFRKTRFPGASVSRRGLMRYARLAPVLGLALVAGFASSVFAADRFITVASTTSTQNSGLFDYLLPLFERASGIEVRVIAVGTGHAIALARKGDADVLFVHHEPSERKFVAEGYGVRRYPVMYNDFVLIGPHRDPAHVRGLGTATAALRRIAKTRAPLVSRGDDSGTNKKELELWSGAGVDARAASGSWYRETGSGMGATLNTASAMNAYTLSDRATWLNFANRGSLEILVEGDPRLFNQYGIILVNPDRFPHVKVADGRAFIDWILSATGQAAINAYRLKGQQAFFANGKPRPRR